MSDENLPSVVGGGKFRQIVVKRQTKAPIARVWRALTSADEIHNWWTHGELDAAEGGKIRLGLEDENCDDAGGPSLDGTVKICIEPYLFEFVWHDDYPDAGLVRFDLIDEDNQTTQITLIQNVPAADVIPAAAGWYELLERLAEYAVTNQPVPENPSRFDDLKEIVARAGIR